MGQQISSEFGKNFLIISGHDFRSHRKANLHFIAEELSKRGKTRFFSTGFSYLSKIRQDPRLNLWIRANVKESFQGVETFLWRTTVHPFNLKILPLTLLSPFIFRFYAACAPRVFHEWIKDSNTIIIESGLGIIFFDLIKSINPEAQVLYIASDDLNTIGCDPYLSHELKRIASSFDGIRIPSLKLASTFPAESKLHYIPHGIDHSISDVKTTSPYSGGINLVSVGSMLFDRRFFEIACKALPEMTFHVIGAGKKAARLAAPNLKLYGEMPFEETVAYIKHADAGIAAYEGTKVSSYLADTSMKLMQYAYLGLPAVCPRMVADGIVGRFGYDSNNIPSIIVATRTAVSMGKISPTNTLTWAEVTDRLLVPQNYLDTNVQRESL